MQLYFLRHGHAEPADGKDDFDRELTDEGVQRLKTAAKVMKSMKLKVDHVFSSPRIRARQTAEIAAKSLKQDVQLRDEVNYDFSMASLRKLLQDVDSDARVMLVGHEPTFSTVIHALTGASVDMKKGGLARVDLDNANTMQGVLVWLIPPKVFDALD